MSRYVRLNKNGFIFKDRQTGFTIERGEVKPLPANIGENTRLWLQAGGLELCEPPQAIAPSEAPTVVSVETKPEVEDFDGRVAELEEFSIKTLRQICVEKGIKFGYRSSANSLAKKIVEHEYGG